MFRSGAPPDIPKHIDAYRVYIGRQMLESGKLQARRRKNNSVKYFIKHIRYEELIQGLSVKTAIVKTGKIR